ncbi:MAG: translation initiation factor IF-3 [Bacilli bacterium]|nr:translation initiation factor IF-3 [Bacilli bacterium]
MEVFLIANNTKDAIINRNIKASQVLVIGPNGEQLGVKGINDALTLAEYAGFDLVLISPNANPPVCKIMDYNKYKYEKNKKQKEALKKQKENNLEMKEYRLSPVIDIHDFNTKLKNVSKYLEKGHKIKVTIRFKGRQMAHTDLGREVLDKFFNELSDIAVLDQAPKMDGRSMFMLLAPKK